MTRRHWLALFRLGFGGLGLAALITQYQFNVANIPGYVPLNFFSFFTVESNIIAAVTLLIAGIVALLGRRPRALDYLRGAATIYMVITGITYSLLLRNVEVDTAVVWVNAVLHYVIPVVMVLDWVMDLPATRITAKQAMVWLIFPVAYLAYSLIRGPIVDWYPYPFLDPRPGGYLPVAIASVGIAIGGVAFALLLAATTRLRKPNSPPTRAK